MTAGHIITHTFFVVIKAQKCFAASKSMPSARFQWDENKDAENQIKHSVAFAVAQLAFLDPLRVIAEDTKHSQIEKRYYCIGKVGEEILTVRFTYREDVIRIIGAGYWRKGRHLYEAINGEK